MRICIITNLNGIGLQRDYELLGRLLVDRGHSVIGVQFDAPHDTPVMKPVMAEKYDLAIFLEVVPRNMLELAPVRWFFGNPEWCKPDLIKTVDRHIDKIFAKTWEAHRIFEPLFPGRVFYTGFLTRDQYRPDIERRPWFLHIGGNSSLRGTQAVLDAWKWRKDGKGMDGHLIVVSRALKDRPEIPMVTYYEDVNEERLISLQNQCLFHIYPSGTEGFGHALHESFSVGAVLITTNAPPMNEFEPCFKLPVTGKSKYNLADVYEVSALDIHELASALLKNKRAQTMDGVLRGDNVLGRGTFHSKNAQFEENFLAHFATKPVEESAKPVNPPGVTKKRGSGLQISFIGNFKASESTENMIKWALEEGLGHDVDMLQENEINFSAIYSSVKFSDVLIWVRTPGWLNIHDREMTDFLDGLKIPSLSVHLDKFWGIPEREALIGVHPFWKTKFVFTADGSRDDDFRALGVNHHWMKPAVSEVYCHPGQPWDMYRCDVGFVGAKDYHSEYPFRRQLVEFLEQKYGDRFKHITGLRGHGLNDFYASCRIVVGDCIFAGTPRYWSDRVPETCGRYGFLLHPTVQGLMTPTACYQAQNLEALEFHIDYWLNHEGMRKQIQRACALYTLRQDTWTVRMREILEVVYG